MLASCVITQLANSQELIILDSAKFSVCWLSLNTIKSQLIDQQSESKALRCYLVDNNKVSKQAVLGKYRWSSDSLIFESLVEPSHNTHFECRLKVEKMVTTKRFITPAKEKTYDPPEVVQVYPTVESIPLNILFFYVQFNQPMNPDFFDYDQLKLIESDGKVKQQVWRHEVNWNFDHTVAAILIHPGRVKRGIDYMENYSEVFVEGEEVTLHVGKAFKSESNILIDDSFSKNYSISSRDSVIPIVQFDQKLLPKSGSNSPLTISFSETMCYGSVLEGFRVLDKNGNSITGTIISDKGETSWRFIPDKVWEKDTYILEFNDYPADLCQNTIYRPFEIPDDVKLKNIEDIKRIRFSIQ